MAKKKEEKPQKINSNAEYGAKEQLTNVAVPKSGGTVQNTVTEDKEKRKDQSNSDFMLAVEAIANMAKENSSEGAPSYNMERQIGMRMSGANRKWNFPTARQRRRRAESPDAAPLTPTPVDATEELEESPALTYGKNRVGTRLKEGTRTVVLRPGDPGYEEKLAQIRARRGNRNTEFEEGQNVL